MLSEFIEISTIKPSLTDVYKLFIFILFFSRSRLQKYSVIQTGINTSRFIQVKVRTLSKQIQEISSATEHAKESLKETINQLIQTAADLNLTSCDEVFEAPNIGECIS